jgi:hypothetical protein
MAQKLRVQYPGVIDSVMDRSDHGLLFASQLRERTRGLARGPSAAQCEKRETINLNNMKRNPLFYAVARKASLRTVSGLVKKIAAATHSSGVHVLAAAVLIAAAPGQNAWAQTGALRGPRLLPPGVGTTNPAVAPRTNRRTIDLRFDTFHLTTNFVVAAVRTGEEVPSQIAFAVVPRRSPATNPPAPVATRQSGGDAKRDQAEAAKAPIAASRPRPAAPGFDWQQANWISYTQSLAIDLGPGEGEWEVWIAAKWTNPDARSASGTHLWVDHTAPHIVITNPPALVISHALIQLQGYSDEQLKSITYDLVNASNRVLGAQGFSTGLHFDRELFEYTTNYFTCFDITLALGTNTIELRCKDLAGNISTNFLTYVFAVDHDKPPPTIRVDWPPNGSRIGADTITVRGQLDDPTAQLTALISVDGRTNTVEGLVERTGHFWFDNLPLEPGANAVAITATDVAGRSSRTNLVLLRAESLITIDPVPPDKLWSSDVTVTGKVKPINQRLRVNGVEAQVKPDGTWVATKVPIHSPNGGTAVFEVTAMPAAETTLMAAPTNKPSSLLLPEELLSVNAGLGAAPVTLNADRPACGSFNLHLTGTTGRNFILLASTNLVNWTPILTNLNSGETFDFTDSTQADYKCRFFRVLPVP